MLVVLEGILWMIRFFFGACIFSFLTVVIDRGKCSTREKPLYRLWQRTDCMGTDPVCEFSVSGRKVQRMWGADPFKMFLDRTYRWSSFYRLRDQIWLRQIRRNIAKRRSDFCIFRNITCGSPD